MSLIYREPYGTVYGVIVWNVVAFDFNAKNYINRMLFYVEFKNVKINCSQAL